MLRDLKHYNNFKTKVEEAKKSGIKKEDIIDLYPYGAAWDLMYDKSSEILCESGSGTGKSFSVLLKIHILCLTNPDIRILITRKTRASMSQTTLITYEKKIIKDDIRITKGLDRKSRQNYTYPNGSEITLCGMDSPERILSSDYDFIFVDEATELEQEDYMILLTRLRNGKLSYQQIILACNPSYQYHWINIRANEGKIIRYKFNIKDNPQFYNQVTGDILTAGKNYLAKLESLDDISKNRFLYGAWTNPEGLIYKFPNENIISPEKFKDVKIEFYQASMDFGFNPDPMTFHILGYTSDNKVYVVEELYVLGKQLEDIIDKIQELYTKYNFREIVCDSASPDKISMLSNKYHLPAIKAVKDIQIGINTCQSVINKGNFYILSNCNKNIDNLLIEAKRPFSITQELQSYCFDSEKPGYAVKKNDHALDSIRYNLMSIFKSSPSEKIFWFGI
jgi:PBSX family phage terminase large subunit